MHPPTHPLADYNVGHPSSQAIAEDVRYLSVKPAKEAIGAADGPTLNTDEITFFKQFGYLIKRGLLASRVNSFDVALDWMWDHVPGHAIRRNDVSSWFNNPSSHWSESDHKKVGSLVGTNWKMRSRGYSGIGTENFLVNDIANHPSMRKLAERFLGSPVKMVKRVRGIYSVFPLKDGEEGRLYPHGDYMASQLSAMVLLDDVPFRCGGFTVWPGSHHRLHPCWDRVSGSTITGERIERYATERDKVLRDTHPVEFFGKKGDVVF